MEEKDSNIVSPLTLKIDKDSNIVSPLTLKIDKDLWNKYKMGCSREKSLNNHVIGLIEKEVEGRK